MSEKYKFMDPVGMYFTTTTAVGWVDVFTRPKLKHIIIESLRYCQKQKGLRIHCWCLMPSHLHMICSSMDVELPKIFRDFKTHTSKEIAKGLDSVYESRRQWMLELFGQVAAGQRRVSNYKIWQDGNHPILLTKPKFVYQKLNYIHNNPVAEEIVSEPEHYLYSSARDYQNMRGLLDIEFA